MAPGSLPLVASDREAVVLGTAAAAVAATAIFEIDSATSAMPPASTLVAEASWEEVEALGAFFPAEGSASLTMARLPHFPRVLAMVTNPAGNTAIVGISTNGLIESRLQV
jgi:hypothetical protein